MRSVSVVLSPRTSENVTQSQPYAAENFTSCAPIAEWDSSARTSTFEDSLSTTSAQRAEGNLRQVPDKASTDAVVEQRTRPTV